MLGSTPTCPQSGDAILKAQLELGFASAIAIQAAQATSGWELDVRKSLEFLPSLYPGGDTWLAKRLVDIREERARCLLALCGGVVAGIAIETPKSVGVVKLSTFYVNPGARGRGVGSALLGRLTTLWKTEGVHSAYVTVAATKVAELEPLLRDYDFVCRSVHEGRYGLSRDEFIYEWMS